MKLTEELFLINKQRNRLKRFRKYENISHKDDNYIEIDFGYIFRISTNPVWKRPKYKQFKIETKNIKRC